MLKNDEEKRFRDEKQQALDIIEKADMMALMAQAQDEFMQERDRLPLKGEIEETANSSISQQDPAHVKVHEWMLQNQGTVIKSQHSPSHHPTQQSGFQQNSEQILKMVSMMQAPKVELPSFDGNPIRYYLFIRAFEENVSNIVVEAAGRLSRLVQCCIGDAKKLIEPCMLLSPDIGYHRALSLLKDRYGNPFTIAQMWIDKLMSIDSRELQLRQYADELRTCQIVLDAMEATSELNTQSNILQLAQKLPTYLKTAWQKVVRKIERDEHRMPSFEDFVLHVEEAAIVDSHPVYGKSQLHSKKARTFCSVAAELCKICNEDHQVFECAKLIGMSIQDREQSIRKNNLCYLCLKPGHLARKCESKTKCNVNKCGKRHHTLLHNQTWTSDREKQREDQGNHDNNQLEGNGINGFAQCGGIALPIVPVRVSVPGYSKTVETYALLDTGSTHTFCTRKLVERLGAQGNDKVLTLSTIEKGSSVCRVTSVSLQVTDTKESVYIDLPCVLAKDELSIGWGPSISPEDLDKWPHLRGVDIPTTNPGKVELLIGQNAPDAIMPQDILKGKKGEPFASRTALGWTLNGPIKAKGLLGNTKIKANFVSAFHGPDYELNRQVDRFFEVESSGLYENKKEPSINYKKVWSNWEKMDTQAIQVQEEHTEYLHTEAEEASEEEELTENGKRKKRSEKPDKKRRKMTKTLEELAVESGMTEDANEESDDDEWVVTTDKMEQDVVEEEEDDEEDVDEATAELEILKKLDGQSEDGAEMTASGVSGDDAVAESEASPSKKKRKRNRKAKLAAAELTAQQLSSPALNGTPVVNGAGTPKVVANGVATPNTDKKKNKENKTPKGTPKRPGQTEVEKTPGSAANLTPGSTKLTPGSTKLTPREKNAPTAILTTPGSDKKKKNAKQVRTGGVIVEDVKEGEGPVALPGKKCSVYYRGIIAKNGKQFDACDRGGGFTFKLGGGDVIKGWDVGVKGMKVGGKRKITIPAPMGYGSQRQADIPPNSTLTFFVELRHIK